MTLGPGGDDPTAQAQNMVQAALASGAPRIYANGLGLAITGSDILITLWSNGAAVAVVNLSFPTAKSLVVDLGIVLQEVEAGIKRAIPTPRDIQEGVARVQQEKSGATPSPKKKSK
jgi:hypothetical protein